MAQLSPLYMTSGNTIALTTWTFVIKGSSPYEYSNASYIRTLYLWVDCSDLHLSSNSHFHPPPWLQWANDKITDFIKRNGVKEAG